MNSTPRKEDSFQGKLDRYIRACPPLILIETTEEERALLAVVRVATDLGRQAWAFSLAEGLSSLPQNGGSPLATREPMAVLDHIEKAPDGALYVLKDPQDWWVNPQFKRKLRDVAGRLKYSKKRLILTCPNRSKLPAELTDLNAVLELPPPNIGELSGVLDHLANSPGVSLALNPSDRQRLLQAALGLSASQAQFVFANAIVQGGVIDATAIGFVAKEKARLIAQSKALQFCEVTQTSEDVAGLAVLKQWLHMRRDAFSQEARDYGLPLPKGIVLLGIPGGGKSLTAKTIAVAWGIPFLRLDVGSLYNSLVGESEANTRRTLAQLDAIAPCVVWLDEVDKVFSQGDLDGGTSRRVLGDFLFWMQEKTAPVFVVVTCNNIANTPPELLRKGRFDEVFFLDLPTSAERRAIFSVHLQKLGRDPERFDLAALARASQDYTGAEIEQAIIQTMWLAFGQGKREFTTQDILTVLPAVIPISKSRAEAIEQLRQWVREGRARSASLPDIPNHGHSSPPIDVRRS